jgi:hypothetical protein
LDDGKAPRTGDSTPSLDQLDALLAQPAAWSELEPELLRHLLFYKCLSYGINPDDEDVPRVTALARIAVDRLHPAVRRQVVLQVARAVERLHREHEVDEGAGYTNGLLPFLVEDHDPSVVAAAACEMAILLPLEDADPMSGPKYVASFMAEIDRDDARAGIVAGLLSLGDKRVDPLVAGAWRRLGDEGRQSLALLIQGVHGLHVGTVKFLLAWLEHEAADPGTPSFGVVAATMARAGLHAAEHGIVEVVRAFPVIAAPEGEPFRVVRKWSRQEFLPVVQRRLAPLASGDHPPELIVSVLDCWGLLSKERRG